MRYFFFPFRRRALKVQHGSRRNAILPYPDSMER